MSDVNDPLAWVDRAEEDYTMARSALRRKIILANGACFHAQQCAEKYLKAALVSKGREFPKTHDLLTLNNLCLEASFTLGIGLRELARLSAHAVDTRYPGAGPTSDDAREALETAKTVRKIVRKWLGLK
jgi:HEPN domain-containing protein